MSRPRRKGRKNWPEYLNARNRAGREYYFWKEPGTGKEYGLGYDFAEAAAQVREVNLKFEIERSKKATLADRLQAKDGYTMTAWLDEFAIILSKRTGKKRGTEERAAGTVARDKRWVEVLREHFGDTLIAKVTTMDCAGLLKKYTDAGKDQTAYNIRAFMADCFTEAEAAGWIPRGTNPASITKATRKKSTRSRLTIEQFQAILKAAKAYKKPWVHLAMLLAILTGQRRADVANMKRADVRDGYLHVQQIKYGQRIKIALDLGLPAIGMTVGEAIIQCKKLGIVGSEYLIHQTDKAAQSKAGDQIGADSLTKWFADIRDQEIQADAWGDQKPATFHEIRALSKQLYKQLGVNTMDLLGHDDAAMDACYSDPRAGWRTVDAPKASA